jgi:hypothetical protein
MYAINEGDITINKVKLKTFSRNVRHESTDLDVEAGTTGFKGYVPREKSSRAYVAFECNQGDFYFDPIKDEDGRAVGIEIACCGDGALMSLLDTLGFSLEALTDESD